MKKWQKIIMRYALSRNQRIKRRREKQTAGKINQIDSVFTQKKPYAERHEVFFGSGLRQISIDYGFQVDLCRELHEEVHKETERGQRITNYWRKYYQKKYMDEQIASGKSKEEALRSWIDLIGRNYL